jgi:GNAT superfamily N-acetyltransferase
LVSAHLLSVAENANTHQPLEPGDERVENDRFVLWMGTGDHPSWNVVQRLRLREDDVDATRAEVHDLLRSRGRGACTWEIGSSATPADLAERLLALGLVDDADPHVIGMLMTDAPPAPPAGVEARAARDLDEFAAALWVAGTAFGMEDELRDETANRMRYDNERALGHRTTFVALLGGEIVGSASSTYVEGAVTLNGGAVLPHARGRGVYRALVAARWDDAVRRGTPALVTQAGRMSAPILSRLGFREVARIRILVDRFGP